MQRKLIVLFAFAIFVLVVGWAVTPAQAHCKKFGGVVDPDCRGSEDPLFEYTAELTLGAFVLPAVDVTPKFNNSELRSESNVVIQRPNDDGVLEFDEVLIDIGADARLVLGEEIRHSILSLTVPEDSADE